MIPLIAVPYRMVRMGDRVGPGESTVVDIKVSAGWYRIVIEEAGHRATFTGPGDHTLSYSATREECVLTPVGSLREDDRVDLYGDPFADPALDHPALECEYAVVAAAPVFETEGCTLIYFEHDGVGFPPSHRVYRRVTED